MSSYLKYRIMNMEPLRIADDSTSQNGQTASLRYIPGSTIRGLVIQQFVKKNIFEEAKKILLSNEVSFLNAYPAIEKTGLIPSPKGFYEDKTSAKGNEKKELQNVVISGEFSDGLKRAWLGSYCYIEEDSIHYYNVKMGSDMKIRINGEKEEQQTVFRSEFIKPKHCFEGYIKLSGNDVIDGEIQKIISNDQVIILGNAGSYGMGKCKILSSEVINETPMISEAFDAENECYMMLLSNTSMRNNMGEYCGLYLKELEELLQVSDLRIKYCSTSTHDIKGYNRTWGTKIPSVLAYEAGSVFHLSYTGVIEKEHMQAVCDRGIGLRRNEGMGRIAFLNDYSLVRYKIAEEYEYNLESQSIPSNELSKDDADTLHLIAKNYFYHLLDHAMQKYVIENSLKKDGLKNSQLGSVESIIMKFRYDPLNARESLDQYFQHATQKDKNQRIQKERAGRSGLQRQVESILSKSIHETLCYSLKEDGKVMGIPVSEIFSREEEEKYKLKLLVEMIRYDHKKEVK